jgi:hypothetical protein
MSNNELAKQLLYEYGQAIRDDWSEVDGRSVRNDLEEVADMIDNDNMYDEQDFRKRLNLCSKGKGHWIQYCSEYHEARS